MMLHARRPEEGEGAKLAQSMDLYAIERLEIGRARLPDRRDDNFVAAVVQLSREHVRLDLGTSDERRVVVRRNENSSHDSYAVLLMSRKIRRCGRGQRTVGILHESGG